jgi:hypothetical protein
MANSQIFRYLVEGECEKKITDCLKSECQSIVAGKVDVLNVTCKVISPAFIMALKKGTTVVLVFDTDRNNTCDVEMLERNINSLTERGGIKNIVCIPQVNNLEDELVRSCNIKEPRQLTKSKSNKNFKADFLHMSNLKGRLENCDFSISDFWSSVPQNEYKGLGNKASKIKIKK